MKKEITLEISIKPFKKLDVNHIEEVANKLFSQWYQLAKHFEVINILIFTSDGSEILEYDKNMDRVMEWGKYIGRANNPEADTHYNDFDPYSIGPHAKHYDYIENPIELTYGWLKIIVSILKNVGNKVTGKTIKVGTMFDPGPEFAKSNFKYVCHPEICLGETMGQSSFVTCYSTVNQDNKKYAGFKNGVKDKTPFSTFFGKQCQEYLSDLDFDYIWFSNGFGFGAEGWSSLGVLFDGKKFENDSEKIDKYRNSIKNFWQDFRKYCPNYPVHTRGTNMSLGIDYATDGVNLNDIYFGGFNIVPPPNSPWAALDKNFGLELAGHMSRIAKLPNDHDYMFRFYLHDPWWANSPWFDRYEKACHDIFLPLAISRFNHDLTIDSPSYLNFLTCDTSWGELPDEACNHVIPHILNSYKIEPDQASPVVWLYPFDEYYENNDLKKPYFDDWYIVEAINNGLPLSTVVATSILNKNVDGLATKLKGSIIVTPIPQRDSEWEKNIFKLISHGVDVIFYGSMTNSSDKLKKMFGIDIVKGIDGEIILNSLDGEVNKVYHDEVFSGGMIDTILLNDENVLYQLNAKKDNEKRIYALTKKLAESNVSWIRGTNSLEYFKGNNLLQRQDENLYYRSSIELRKLLKNHGISINFDFVESKNESPALMIHRNNNAFYFSNYAPNNTVKFKINFDIGAPLFVGHDIFYENGCSTFYSSRASQFECRVFVQQNTNSVITCRDVGPVSYVMKRRYVIEGLKNAKVYIFCEKGMEHKTELLFNTKKPYIIGNDNYDYKVEETRYGTALVVENVSGMIVVSTEFDDINYLANDKKFVSK